MTFDLVSRRSVAAGALLALAPAQSFARLRITSGNKSGSLKKTSTSTTTTSPTTTTTTTTATTTTTTTTSPTYCGLTLDSYGKDVFAGHTWSVHRDTSKPYGIQEWVGLEPLRHRFEVRSGDSWNGETTKNRAEFGCTTRMPFGQSIWLSYALRIRAGAPITNWNILGQFHSTPDSGDADAAPPFALNFTTGEKLRFVRRFDPNPLTTAAPANYIMQERPIVRDRWYRMVARIVFGWENNGAVEIWWDGVKIVSLANTNIGYNDMRGPYWKFGVYRANVAETLIADFANMELGLSSLLDRVTNPLPV